MGRLRFRILGTLTVEEDGELLAVGGSKLRVVLGMLLARAGTLVPVDTLFEVLWGEDPPRTARTAVQVHISSLRRLLRPTPTSKSRPGREAIASTPSRNRS